MEDSRTFILSYGEMIHILASHFVAKEFFTLKQYNKGSIVPSADGKTYKFRVWMEGEVDAFDHEEEKTEEKTEEKPNRHIDLSDSYIEKEQDEAKK